MTNPRPPSRTRPAAGAAAVALALALPLAACAGTGQAGPGGTGAATSQIGGSQSVQTPTRTGADDAVEADLAQILADPGAYDGQRVTTSGTVQQVAPGFGTLTPVAGSGGASATAGGSPAGTGVPSGTASPSGSGSGQGLYVVLPRDAAVAADGGAVTVTGVLQQPLDVAVLEEDFGVTIDPAVLQRLGVADPAAVLVAEELTAGAPSPGS